ncbi:carnitine transport binding protein OpuCC precursor [Peptococcaceae bacterium CEB3]|nr:carnitine transport binding protein OpuCC precursor [Peptococcaceae bacterium CEB3]
MSNGRLLKLTGVGLIVALTLLGCGTPAANQAAATGSTGSEQYPIKEINIASQAQSEAIIVDNMLKEIIESQTPIKVKLQETSGGSALTHSLMEKNNIQMYFGYDGTELDKIFHLKYTAGEFVGHPDAVSKYVKDNELKKFGIWVSPSLGFQDTYAIAVKGDVAKQDHLKTFSDCAPYAKNWIFATDPDVISDVMPGFEKAYPNLKFKKVISMDYNLMYQALANNSVQAIMAFSTDGRLTKLKEVPLTDNKNYFPPYNGIVLITNDVVQKDHLDKVLAKLWGSISTSEMTHMNELVDVEKDDPAKVAHDFLTQKGII